MNLWHTIEHAINSLYEGLLWFLNEQSLEFRLILNTIVIVLTTHLLIKRFIELRRRDYIFSFRLTWFISYAVILVFSIPVEWYLITAVFGEANATLQNLARVAGGFVLFGFAVLGEAIDIVISRINKRAQKQHEEEDNEKVI